MRVGILLVCILFAGCTTERSESSTTATASAKDSDSGTSEKADVTSDYFGFDVPKESRQFMEELVEEIEENEATGKVADPVFEIPKPKYWLVDEPTPLGHGDEGFTVGYNHAFAPTVTVYQYTRGIDNVPDGLESEIVTAEFSKACAGVKDIAELMKVELEPVVMEKCLLGDSQTESHHAQFLLHSEDVEKRSDVYVWSHGGCFIKLRATWQGKGSPVAEKAFAELLTSLGKACE